MAALQEDVDIIRMSFHAPIYCTAVAKILNLLKGKDTDHIPLIVGGVVDTSPGYLSHQGNGC